jgi:Helicase conserved C-terminal domain/WYL domain
MSARSLADALRGADDDALGELLAARPDLLAPVPADIGQLAARAATAPSVARALDRADAWTMAVLEAVCVAGEAPGYDEVRGLLPDAPDEAVRSRIDRLIRHGLVWGDDTAMQPTSGVREIVGLRAAGLGPSLRLPLTGLGPGRLRAMAADLGLPEPVDSPAAIDAITSALSDPHTVGRLVGEGPPGTRELLDRLVWGPPTGNVERADRTVDRSSAATPGDWLLAHGLLVSTDPSSVVLPREVALVLRGGRLYPSAPVQPPVPRTVATSGIDAVDRAAAERAATLVRNVEAVLEAWGLDGPGVLRSGGLGVRDLRRTSALLDADETMTPLVLEIARQAGLVAASEELDQRWLPTADYDVWRLEDTGTRWAVLARAWLTSPRVAGLTGSRDDRDRPLNALGPGIERTLAAETREQVLGVLAAMPGGTSPDPADVDAVLTWRLPRRPARLRSRLTAWTITEAEFVGITGLGALSTAGGAIASGRSGDAAVAVERWLPEPVRHVVLQGDLTAVAPGPVAPDVAAELSLMADVESTGAATVYRFGDTSIRRALDAGSTADELHAILAAVSTTPVPQALTYAIDDVARRHGQLRVGAVSSYVRCDSPALLAEVLADRRTSSLGLRRLAPTVLGSTAAPDRLLEVLRKIGLAPVAESAQGAVLIHRPDAMRTMQPGRRDTRGQPDDRAGPTAEPAVPEPALIRSAVRALRAGERAAGPRGPLVQGMAAGTDAVAVPRGAATATLTHVRAAIAEDRPIWIGYVDAHGATSNRIVEPIRLDGGFLTAYDHRRDAVRTFAVHRITGVADLEEDPRG